MVMESKGFMMLLGSWRLDDDGVYVFRKTLKCVSLSKGLS